LYAPYVPTPSETVRRMLRVAEVCSEDVVYDLGCGDGRVLVMAVEEFGAKGAVGYEISRQIYRIALSEVLGHGLMDKIRVINGDLFEANLSMASVITLYLNTSANERLKPKLVREARIGARVISRNFAMVGWRTARKEYFDISTLYLYRIPEAFAGENKGSPRGVSN
jgi:predicted RNA methylase